MLCSLQCGHCSSSSRHRNGPVGMRRLPHLTHVHPRSDKRTVLLLSHSQPSLGSKSGGTRQLRELQDAPDVPIWRTVGQMRCLQFCYISWCFVKHTGTEVHQLELAINLPVTGLTTHGYKTSILLPPPPRLHISVMNASRENPY